MGSHDPKEVLNYSTINVMWVEHLLGPMSRLVKLVQAETVEEGVGAIAKRLFPHSEFGHLDPFVLFDEYFIEPSAYFPMHPHSGFEGIQFLSEGSTLYRDMSGNEGTITPGGARRFLAGKDFQHLEEPRYSGVTRGFLLWIKLPRANMDMASSYIQVEPERIERVILDGVMVSKILGEDTIMRTITPVIMQHLTMTAGSRFEIETNPGWNSFLYLADGVADLSGLEIPSSSGVILADNSDYVLTAQEGSELMYVSGERTGERILLEGHRVRK